MKNYEEECRSLYKRLYDEESDRLISIEKEKTGVSTLSKSKAVDIDCEAQKFAIRESIVSALGKYPEIEVSALWSAIYKAHLFRKAGMDDLEKINKVISAAQSWKKSSGHAFEEMIRDIATAYLHKTGISVVLQKELKLLIKANVLKNEPRDISWLKEQIKDNIFDLYCVVEEEGRKYCFGCVQAKTSIRDRVTRDREPSIHAMQSFFWSIIFVLDGAFLQMPKFRAMVNGGTPEFPKNGWHGMYAFSVKEQIGRIYPITIALERFKNHALLAKEQWLKQRQWFSEEWTAE